MSDYVEVKVESPRIADMALARVSGATLEEIGEAHGITRERVRQLLQKAGLEGWESPFKAEQTKKNTTLPGAFRAGQRKAKKQKHRRQVERLRALAVSLGRVPTVKEAAAAFGLHFVHLYTMWKAYPTQRPGIGMGRLFRLAGIQVRGAGALGVIDRERHIAFLRTPRAVINRTKHMMRADTDPHIRVRNSRRRPEWWSVAVCGPNGCFCPQRSGRSVRDNRNPPPGIL